MDGAMRDDGERGSVAGAAGSADITAILSLDWAEQDWFDRCDDVHARVRQNARQTLYTKLLMSAPQAVEHYFAFRDAEISLPTKIRKLLLADSVEAVQLEIDATKNKLRNAYLTDKPVQPLQLWLNLVKQRKQALRPDAPQASKATGPCDWCLHMAAPKKMDNGINCWEQSPELQHVIQNITDDDILAATFRLQKDPVYEDQNMTRLGKNVPEHGYELTGRQARLVLFYKIYHFLWGEKPAEEDRVRKKICQCIEAMVREEHPNDEWDVTALQLRAERDDDYGYHEWA